MTARPATTRTPDPATAAQRRRRVTAGLAELDIWLADQVRTGLARVDRSTGAFEVMAARMVDAQAPGVAARLRALAAGDQAAPDRPRRTLAELAALHLLVTAHRDIDDLPEALAATVRTHIGYPMPTATVRRHAAVRDHWMTLGMRVSADDRLHTRRTWLYGRHTHRWALLVEHSFGDNPSFASTAPAPGRMADAELHYYPGTPPLRALWGVRNGVEEPFTTIPAPPGPEASDHPADHGEGGFPTDRTEQGASPTAPERRDVDAHAGSDCDAALAAYAEALAADPWLRSWPVLLREVTPVVDGPRRLVVDATGAALPLTGLAQPWRMLGAAGGHPVTVLGEWTADGLVPISLLVHGQIVDVREPDAAPEPMSAATAIEATPPAAPDGLTATALLGTARRPLEPGDLPVAVAASATELTGDPPLLVLAAAVLREVYERAARTPGAAPVPEPAPDDPRPLLPGPAAVRLADMLRVRSPFLPEWFEAALPHDLRTPDELCAHLLDTAQDEPGLRAALLRLAGPRGRWLAARHPTWHELFADAAADGQHSATAALRPTTGGADSDAWLSGTPTQRRDRLAGLRGTDPAAARQLLEQTWPEESEQGRAELLAVLADGLGADDEALLETALDDRRAEVRRTAAGLLALLPGSAFAHRMRARAARWLRIEHCGEAVVLHVGLPEQLDDTDRRDGITDRTVEFSYRWNGVPDAVAGRLRHLVAATPVGHWTESVGTPRAALRARMPDRYRQPLLDGLLDATLHQRDPAWAAALFDNGVPSDTALLRRRELFALMPQEDRVTHLRRLDSAWLSELEALLPAMEHPWPQALGQHVILLLLERARISAQHRGAHGTGPAAHRSLLTTAATHLPVDATGQVAVAAQRCADPSWQRAFDRLAEDLNHRRTMLEELPQ